MRTATVSTALLLGIGLLTPPAMGASTGTGPGSTTTTTTGSTTTTTTTQGPETKTGSATGGTSAAPSATFEGDIAMRVTTDKTKGPQDVKVHVKGDKVRYDLPASASSNNQPVEAVVDMSTKKVLMVMPAQKSYAVLDLNAIPPESKQATAQRLEGASANWTAAPTGTTKQIAGHHCNQWQATNTQSNVKVDACLTPDVRIDYDALLPESMLPPAWAAKMRNGELPLSASVYSADGKQTFNSQVTNVTHRTVPDSEFAPPSDYKRVELPMSAFGDLMPSTR